MIHRRQFQEGVSLSRQFVALFVLALTARSHVFGQQSEQTRSKLAKDNVNFVAVSAISVRKILLQNPGHLVEPKWGLAGKPQSPTDARSDSDLTYRSP